MEQLKPMDTTLMSFFYLLEIHRMQYSMRLLFLSSLLFLPFAISFAPAVHVHRSTALHSTKRRLLITGIMGLILKPHQADAKPASTFFFDETIENVREPSQMRTGGRLDINSAFVVSGEETKHDYSFYWKQVDFCSQLASLLYVG